MKRIPIGFNRNEEPEESKGPTPIKNLTREVKAMMTDLDIDEVAIRQHMLIDKEIRRELLRLYKTIKKLGVLIKKRDNLSTKVSANFRPDPRKTLDLLIEIDELDQIIIPEIDRIEKELSKHVIPETLEIYDKIKGDLTATTHLKTMVGILNSTFSRMTSPVMASFNQRETDNIRRDLLKRNPGLK